MNALGGARLLVVDDERQIRKLLEVSLSAHGATVSTVPTANEAVTALADRAFDLVLLDLGLPDVDGLEVVRQVREWSELPIIVVSVREDEASKVAALDLGADDFVTKPFAMGELLARIRAALRRATSGPDEPVVELGSVAIDFGRRQVTRDGRELHLTPSEYDLLRVLTRHRGKVLTHRQLLREARGPAYEGDRPLLRVHLVGLRHKLDIPPGSPGYIQTEPGIGYRLLDAPLDA